MEIDPERVRPTQLLTLATLQGVIEKTHPRYNNWGPVTLTTKGQGFRLTMEHNDDGDLWIYDVPDTNAFLATIQASQDEYNADTEGHKYEGRAMDGDTTWIAIQDNLYEYLTTHEIRWG